jgi:hypothetical protein
MKHLLLICCFALFAITSCSTSNKKYEKETIEMENLEEELNETAEELSAETEDMTHDVDSLLNDILTEEEEL